MLWTMCAVPDHVEISKKTIRDHAMAFSKKWADATSEAAERQLFWNDFFAIFGLSLKNVGFFEVAAKRLSTQGQGWIDLLVPGRMAVEHKSAGKDLDKAMDQLVDYLPSLHAAAMPRLLVACNFQEFYWKDLEAHTEGRFGLAELSQNVELFWWLAGHGTHEAFADEEEANLVATGYMAKLHDAVLASGYDPHALREWLTRILFCLFADDTEVWDRNAFSNYLFLHTRPDGSDLGPALSYLFQILNTPEDERAKTLDDDLAAFTYINGDVFETVLAIPSCDEDTRNALLEACKFNWSAISPAIFGSMFQNVMTPAERRHLGAHYTTEENILKTIRPLFLDELEVELSKAKSKRALDALHLKMAGLTFLDPACGCGNFLVIAYRELRRLETELLRKQTVREGVDSHKQAIGLGLLCKITVGQFYGIELEEFPARIARTALYLMDHKANLEVSKEFGQYFARFPIPTSPHIVIGNALRMEWDEVLPRNQGHYVLGNPPFVGQKTRSGDQADDMRAIWGSDFARWLDYVTCWYRVAADYIGGTNISCAFVSTNSISQGEQVARLWGPLKDRGIVIDFAYRTFPWTSEAQGKANVHVVIIGFSLRTGTRSRPLFEYQDATGNLVAEWVSHINPYLTDGPDVLVNSRRTPLSTVLSEVNYGNKPSDGGHLVVDSGDLPEESDAASPYIRPYLGSQELLHGEKRYCIWMDSPDASAVRASSLLRNRLDAVKKFRASSTAADTRKMASQPWRFFRVPQPASPYIAIPRHVSETREWFTVAFVPPEVIASDALFTAVDPDGLVFGVLSSAMFIAWLRTVGGSLESRLRFSGPMVFNTFPLPIPTDRQRSQIIAAGKDILEVRSRHPDSSLADLYDPLAMRDELHKAHQALDKIVDSVFAPRRKFQTEASRLSVLFEKYESLTSPLLSTVTPSRRAQR